MSDVAWCLLEPSSSQKARLRFALGEVLWILLEALPRMEIGEADYLRKVDGMYRLAADIARENGWNLERCQWDPLTFRFWMTLPPKQTADVATPQYVN